ncbi:OmpA family protein [Myroides marinus]|uniref:OmpA family protein n=1 Tax=Myroides marinus TaxID=703342 RepID=UPI0025768A2C|nr:OmpA family protein [Myroides marinus]MDM1384183.1 OmpA family protein [Myroides marinus]MDM1390796.1 OmpA family protein [Myroides marinus]MDM1533048.1 OmpA family protein [Myroides marinus]MDM1539975.1 OmpA family protein [Myroides marinus]
MRKQLLKISLFSMLLLAGVNTQAQRVAEKKADKEYQTQAYVDAIKIYERIAKKGYTNADMLKKLADAYYFNGKLPEANQWYQALFEGEYDDKGKEAIPAEYYYRYAQTLKSVENYDKSRQMMEEFAKLEGDDSRAQLFEASKDRYLKEIENNADRYELKNISVNTEYSDYGAALYGDQLIYTSARNTEHQSGKRLHDWTNESFTSLFSSKINADGTFDEPQRFAPELETKVNEATAVFTQDGKTMYFTRNNTNLKGKRRLNKGNSTLLKIYKATLSEEGKWANVEELPFNSDNYNTAHPALTPDDKWLYFSSDREGTLGQSDIFRVALYPTGEYGKVENIGTKVNTSGRETFPFISKDHFLFFSSDGHPGLGGLDVFVVKINVDGSLGNATNMGTPINSSTDDFGFYIDKKTRKGFVSSNRANGVGGDDIYFFMEKVCRQILEGIVFDKETKEVLANAKVTVYNSGYNVIGEIMTDDKGYYKVEDLDCNKKYRLKAEAIKYNTEEVVVLMDAKMGGIKKQDIALEKTEKPISKDDDLFKKLKLNPIYFDFDKSNIRRDASIELMKVVEVLKEYPTMKIDVRSHTDSRGNDDYNLKLSDRRAKSTVAWIISQGIDASRVTGQGYGETQLQNQCSNGVPCTVEEHQLNRRSEFIVTEL